jgi:ABC-type spermidine/putrescine transport system permease subunit II
MPTRGERIVDALLWIVAGVSFLILYAPVLIGALFSLVEVQRGEVLWHTATLAWYGELWRNQSILDAIRLTLLVAGISVVVASILAVVLALYVHAENATGRRFLELVIYLPFLLPPIVTGLALLVFFGQVGLSRGTATVAIGHTVFVLAVIYRLVLTRLQSLPRSLVEASADLGATRWQTFRHVLWPQLAPAILTGAILALTLSFDETLITTFLAGDQMTLPIRLWAMMRVGFTPEINALVTIVLVVSIALTLVIGLRLQPRGQAEDD